jgi:hypothetical protein
MFLRFTTLLFLSAGDDNDLKQLKQILLKSLKKSIRKIKVYDFYNYHFRDFHKSAHTVTDCL